MYANNPALARKWQKEYYNAGGDVNKQAEMLIYLNEGGSWWERGKDWVNKKTQGSGQVERNQLYSIYIGERNQGKTDLKFPEWLQQNEGKHQVSGSPEFTSGATTLAELTPIIGDAIAAKEIWNELQNSPVNWGLVALLGGGLLVGLIPGIGDAAAKAMKAAVRPLLDNMKRVGKVDPQIREQAAALRKAQETGLPVPVSCNLSNGGKVGKCLVLPDGEITSDQALEDIATMVPQRSLKDPRANDVFAIGMGDPDAHFKKELEGSMFKDFYEKNGTWYERSPDGKDKRANPKRARREQGQLVYDDVKEWLVHYVTHGRYTDSDTVRKIISAPNFDREQIMEPRFYKYWQGLPDMVPVFRGAKGGVETVEAPSWSLTLREAEKFAIGEVHTQADKTLQPRIFKAYIPKDSILTIDNIIGEPEVILDPHKLSDVKLVRDEAKGYSDGGSVYANEGGSWWSRAKDKVNKSTRGSGMVERNQLYSIYIGERNQGKTDLKFPEWLEQNQGKHEVAGTPEFTKSLVQIAEFLPIVGDVMAGYDTADAFIEGDYKTAAILGVALAVGLVPGVGDAVAAPFKALAKNMSKADIQGVARAIKEGDTEFLKGWTPADQARAVGARPAKKRTIVADIDGEAVVMEDVDNIVDMLVEATGKSKKTIQNKLAKGDTIVDPDSGVIYREAKEGDDLGPVSDFKDTREGTLGKIEGYEGTFSDLMREHGIDPRSSEANTIRRRMEYGHDWKGYTRSDKEPWAEREARVTAERKARGRLSGARKHYRRDKFIQARVRNLFQGRNVPPEVEDEFYQIWRGWYTDFYLKVKRAVDQKTNRRASGAIKSRPSESDVKQIEARVWQNSPLSTRFRKFFKKHIPEQLPDVPAAEQKEWIRHKLRDLLPKQDRDWIWQESEMMRIEDLEEYAKDWDHEQEHLRWLKEENERMLNSRMTMEEYQEMLKKQQQE